jgi:hypothetical protein
VDGIDVRSQQPMRRPARLTLAPMCARKDRIDGTCRRADRGQVNSAVAAQSWHIMSTFSVDDHCSEENVLEENNVYVWHICRATQC